MDGRAEEASDFGAYWDGLRDQTRQEASRPGCDYFTVALATLLDVAVETPRLRRYMPFTSMCRLCLARSAFPFEDIQPAYISALPDGVFIVESGPPYPGSGPIVFQTDDPTEAIAELLRLL